MRRIAIQSLFFDRGKLIASLLGVALATTLAFVQIGLYRGFEISASTVIQHVGGDLWVVPTGIDVLDNAQVMSPGPRQLLLSHPCVADARAVIYGFVVIQKPSGTRSTALIVAVEPRPGREVPWALAQGSVAALDQPLRVSVDRTDLRKLELPADALGGKFEISGREVVVAAITEGIRSFTLNPYFFTSLTNARRLVNLSENQAMYYAVDLAAPGCAADLVAWMKGQPDVRLLETAVWIEKTEAYWVGGSGAGTVLAFTAILGLIVGGVIVGQTLYSMTKEHLLELATLKAVGARPLELAGFVLWQVSVLGTLGGAAGFAIALALKRLLAQAGLTVVLSPYTVGLGAAATVAMCLLASVTSLRTVFKVETAQVLR
jgi:putative ABC transport system permease protein